MQFCVTQRTDAVVQLENETEHGSPHHRESVVVQEKRLVGEERTVQLHEQGLQGTGVHCRSVPRTGVGEVRVHQKTLP